MKRYYKDNGFIVNNNGLDKVDLNKLNIFKDIQYDAKYLSSVFEPNKIPEFTELTRIYIDIETTGLDPSKDRIKYIGVKLANLNNHRDVFRNAILDKDDHTIAYYYCDDETLSLDEQETSVINRFNKDLVRILESADPTKDTFIGFYNGYDFDIPFIIKRSEILEEVDMFGSVFSYTKLPDDQYRYVSNNTAVKNNMTARYKSIDVKRFAGERPQFYMGIADIYHLVLMYDFVHRKLNSHSLKSVPYELGLITEPRTDIDNKTLQKLIATAHITKDHTKVLEYLKDDLVATEILGEYLIPPYYYQRTVLPYKLNYDIKFKYELSTSRLLDTGNGGKWNKILQYHYHNVTEGLSTNDPHKEEYKTLQVSKLNEGGANYARSGLYHNVAKIDVASMYPSIMLLYGVYSRDKDTRAYQLQVLNFLRTQRLNLKKLAKTGDTQAKDMSDALKILINSAYGILGTDGLEYNSIDAGAIVTAYGRKIIDHMRKLIEDKGAFVVSFDTDGAYLSFPEGNSQDLLNIAEYVRANLPGNDEIKIDIEVESILKYFYVPKTKDGKAAKKTYICFYGKDKKTTYRGTVFNGRNRSKLEREYKIDLLKCYLYNGGRSAMEKHHNDMVKAIKAGKISLDAIRVTKTVPANHENVLELCKAESGLLKTETIGDKTIYSFTGYYTDRIVFTKKNKRSTAKGNQYKPTNKEPYSVKYYLDIVNDYYEEILEAIISFDMGLNNVKAS